MKIGKIAKGGVKTLFWGTATKVVWKVGGTINEFGKELIRLGQGNPYIAVWGALICTGGVVVQAVSVVPGVCTVAAGIDVVNGVCETDEE